MLERTFLAFCWVPPLLYAATIYVVRQYEGWGQWAAAPLLLPPFFLSLAWLVWGGVIVWRETRATRRAVMLGATLLAASPALVQVFSALTS